MRYATSTRTIGLIAVGLMAAATTSGCKLFERELNSWEPPEEQEESAFFSLSTDVEIEARTTGSLPDHDGYVIWYEQTTKQPLGIDETIRIDDVSWKSGQYPRWYLGRVGPQCSVLGGTRFPERPETWYLGRWFLTEGALVQRKVDVDCEPEG